MRLIHSEVQLLQFIAHAGKCRASYSEPMDICNPQASFKSPCETEDIKGKFKFTFYPHDLERALVYDQRTHFPITMADGRFVRVFIKKRLLSSIPRGAECDVQITNLGLKWAFASEPCYPTLQDRGLTSRSPFHLKGSDPSRPWPRTGAAK